MAQHTHDLYVIDDEISRIDWPRVHGWLTSSYWSQGISMDRVKRAASNSALVVGAYTGDEQVAYARVVSDKTRFAWICDVWVDANHRGRGLARAMLRGAMDDPEFANLLWVLGTRDAHGVYRELGFTSLERPERWMACDRRKPV
jgi:GNAT superfamily N-acetyltransferase